MNGLKMKHHILGLNKNAEEWLQNNRAIELDVVKVLSDAFTGLPTYTLKKWDTDEGVIEEFVQSEPWFNGFITMTALRFFNSKRKIDESLWCVYAD